MNVDVDRVRPRRARPEHERGNLPVLAIGAIEGRKAHQLRRHELQRIDRPGLALRVAHQRIAFEFEHEHIARRLRALERQREALAGAIESDAADLAVGQRRQDLAVRGQVDHREPAQAVDVRHPREKAAVVAARELLDVPGDVGGERFHRAGGEVHAPQLLEFAVAIGDEVDAAAISREQRLRHARGCRCLR